MRLRVKAVPQILDGKLHTALSTHGHLMSYDACNFNTAAVAATAAAAAAAAATFPRYNAVT